jgi:hypothetical protein
MVYNTTRIVKLPHHNASNLSAISANSKHGMNFINGSGMSGCGPGSVLLRTAGGGAASSYQDMDDYISTTGINPYTRANVARGKGISKSLSDKLSKIQPTTGVARKNIVMSM